MEAVRPRSKSISGLRPPKRPSGITRGVAAAIFGRQAGMIACAAAWVTAGVIGALIATLESGACASAAQPPQDRGELHVAVADENGRPVPSAHITLTPKVGQPTVGETDYAGRKGFTDLAPGTYTLTVEREGFFAVTQPEIAVGEATSVEVTLNHVREFTERVNVVYSPPAIDPAKTQSSETLNSEQIIDLPFPVTRDIRYALPLLPGVLQDSTGQLHVDGADTRQVDDEIDGFSVSDPGTGQFLMRVSVDAVRAADVASSRYSTEFGQGSGGVISLRTGMGDDHWRLTGTDFIPGLQTRRGIHPRSWTPRGLVSGPIRKGKAWFMDALEGEYNLGIFRELPAGADSYSVWRGSNLAKVQTNLAQNNNLTVGFLVNSYLSPRAGLDPLDPLSTTRRNSMNGYFLYAKDQHLFENGTLLEVGVAASSFNSRSTPQGTQTYVVTPDGTSGNYYSSNHSYSARSEEIANIFLPRFTGAGKHEFKTGIQVDRLEDRLSFLRQVYLVEREDGTLSRSISFANVAPFTRHNLETGAYVQDRWSITKWWLLEPGLRLDWDEIVRGAAVSPRIASTLLVKSNGDTKISWGAGVYRDPSNLDFLTRAFTGTRTDLFYDATGQNLLQPPVLSAFTIDQSRLRFPDALNASVALEQKLPRTTYLRVQLMERRARDIWTFVNPGASTLPSGPFTGQFILTNDRRDHYTSAEVSLRHVFKQNHVVFASYTRSRALTNADFTYTLDNVLFSPQAGGPLAWDTPNRFLAWGWLPLPHKIDAASTVDWRTGFPFTLQNDSLEVVGAPYSQRFQNYFSLNLSLERRFTLLGCQWALRAGLDNLTNHPNYSYVDSNVDSPHFLTFSGAQNRALVARIRLLGRK
jgi:hypothetical protein